MFLIVFNYFSSSFSSFSLLNIADGNSLYAPFKPHFINTTPLSHLSCVVSCTRIHNIFKYTYTYI